MTYLACVLARLVRQELTARGSLTGELEAGGHRYTYETRASITDAANKIFKAVTWKPSCREDILIDGDFIQGNVIIDHVQKWQPEAYAPIPAHHALVKRLEQTLPDIPELNRLVRHHAQNDNGDPIRIARWQTPVSGRLGRLHVPAIVSAILLGGELRFRAQSQQGARPVPLSSTNLQPLLEGVLDPRKANARHADRAFVPREAASHHAGRRKLRAGDPNKWVAGQPYKPVGMPAPLNANDDHPGAMRSDTYCPF